MSGSCCGNFTTGNAAWDMEYAYLYPGMNKVLQAGGRVIRTEKDLGHYRFAGRAFQLPPVPQPFSTGMGSGSQSHPGHCGGKSPTAFGNPAAKVKMKDDS